MHHGVRICSPGSCTSRSTRSKPPLSRIVAGRALAQLGDRDRAIAELEKATATFAAVGAVRYRDEAERALRQLGRGAGASCAS
jgi:hypothetical protein